ncbi:unnamed protein product [Paramecium sonneborni]|uniref:Uncharacterized protein n=1 Tax=Paramecium sonneborni TaxID=65129 RepID=A0A8S1QTR8_9CILI|nr:unnamed protein product [Paramecium sonneborni]
MLGFFLNFYIVSDSVTYYIFLNPLFIIGLYTEAYYTRYNDNEILQSWKETIKRRKEGRYKEKELHKIRMMKRLDEKMSYYEQHKMLIGQLGRVEHNILDTKRIRKIRSYGLLMEIPQCQILSTQDRMYEKGSSQDSWDREVPKRGKIDEVVQQDQQQIFAMV